MSTCARCGKKFGFFSTRFNSETVYDTEFHYKLTLNAKYPSNPYMRKNLCSECYREVYENAPTLLEAQNLESARRYAHAKTGWVIAGSVLLIIFGVVSVLLLSANNGVTQELTTSGYTFLAMSVFLSLLGIVFIIVGVVSKDRPIAPANQSYIKSSPSPYYNVPARPTVLTAKFCKYCGKELSPDSVNFCTNCGQRIQ